MTDGIAVIIKRKIEFPAHLQTIEFLIDESERYAKERNDINILDWNHILWHSCEQSELPFVELMFLKIKQYGYEKQIQWYYILMGASRQPNIDIVLCVMKNMKELHCDPKESIFYKHFRDLKESLFYNFTRGLTRACEFGRTMFIRLFMKKLRPNLYGIYNSEYIDFQNINVIEECFNYRLKGIRKRRDILFQIIQQSNIYKVQIAHIQRKKQITLLMKAFLTKYVMKGAVLSYVNFIIII